MKEYIGRSFKIIPQKNPIDPNIVFKIISIDKDEDGDEYFSIEWIREDSSEPRISKMYFVDFNYFFSTGDYFWI